MMSVCLLDLTLPSPVENLALDDALLDEVEESNQPVLRLWESDRYFVVLGRSSSLSDDVHLMACRQDNVPILRRASGGGTVLQGPGCLSYAVVLPIWLHADLRDIRLTNVLILTRMASALASWQPAIAAKGISDLTVNGQKIGGSAQKRKRKALLFHGTVLYQMQAEIISRYLRQPKRQPDYRADRPHCEFLRTLRAPVRDMKEAIARVWGADRELEAWPQARMGYAIADVLERSSLQAPEDMVMHAQACNGDN